MFGILAQRIQSALHRLRTRGKLSPQDIKEALREVRIALLEADVNYRVVKDFIARVEARAVGADVLQSLTPGQQVIKIVHEELTRTLGGDGAGSGIGRPARTPGRILLVGLQGSGKTTSAAKLARYLVRQGRTCGLIAADAQRPAAIDQLERLGERAGVRVYADRETKDPVAIVARGLDAARAAGLEWVVVDTAGRLHVDSALMEELERVARAAEPDEVFLVLDAMTGQDAVNVAQEFASRLPLTGFLLTKLDGDARGGAALSLVAVTGKPIRFAGVGEKLEDLEAFHPDRMASRILGMGDILSLIEKAEASIDRDQVKGWARRLARAEFTLEDFLDQLRQVRRMGPLDQLLSLLPGYDRLKRLQGAEVDERELIRIEAIIQSMTPQERRRPEILDGSRKRRIARGSGTRVQDVNRLLNQFGQTRELLRRLQKAPPGRKGPFPLAPLE